ncbi:hypothetical protein E4T56_gene1926 [Termitomyces sp. T112]|nr:hypothetical protein E4T56_gene1926 [Termitomyces sp. T112]KAH0590861.1 hypothetical protein H2248_000978 [Termitomyces sp. 'cryptogamus']
MTLPRSKSAPDGVPALKPAAPLVRAASFHTIEETMKSEPLVAVEEHGEEERVDAFNLSGFFPGEKKWGWVREEGGMKTGSLFGASDRMTREAIKGEDKLGVLRLGELLARLLKSSGAVGGHRDVGGLIDGCFPIWDIDGGNSREFCAHVG